MMNTELLDHQFRELFKDSSQVGFKVINGFKEEQIMNTRPSYKIELESDNGNRWVSDVVDYAELKDIVNSRIFFVRHMIISKYIDGNKKLYKEIIVM